MLKENKNYPEVVVVELGADKPGDIAYLTSFIKPDIGVITAIGETPVHLEHYEKVEDVVREKMKIVDALDRDKGVAITNVDDIHLKKTKKSKKSLTFGFDDKADIRIKNFKTESVDGSDITISYQGSDYEIFLSNCIGESFAYVAACVFATGIALDIAPEKIPTLIKKIRPSAGRLYPLKGKKNTTILDGSYNASPSSMAVSLKTLTKIKAKRKIAVIGDMLELGSESVAEHRKIGKLAGKFADMIFAVGSFSKEVRDSAIGNGIPESSAYSFEKSEDAIKKIEEIIKPGDLIMVKGSQGIRTEKIVYAIMEDKDLAKELLVRQTKEWKK